VIQTSGGLRISTADRWAGRVEHVGNDYIVCIKDGYEPNDHLAGYRVFNIADVVEIGDHFFAREPRRLASPRKPVAGAVARVV
jgi:hypothetical protein